MRCAVTLLVTLAACTRGDEQARRADLPLPNVPRVLVVSGLKGTTEPCGCTSKPLGGLDRVAARIEAYRAAGPAHLLVVGDTFFEGDQSKEPWAAARTRVVAQLLARLEPARVVLGPRDAPAMAAAAALPSTSGDQLLRLGAVRVGVVLAEAEGDVKPRVHRLRAQGADLVVGLSAHGRDQSKEWLAKQQGIDLVIAGGGAELHTPRAGALVLEAGDRGRYLGVLELHATAEGAWAYDDQGAGQQSAVEARVQRLTREIAALPEGPARQAREAQLALLREQLAAPGPPPPAGRHFSWRAEPITQDLPASQWASSMLADYNRSLCDIMTAASRDKTCPPASPADVFVGSRTCFGCHEAAFAVYQRSKHAHAWRTLERRGKMCDPGCIGCHSVGYDTPGGYCHVSDADIYENVGCESCHGPGAGHARAPYQRDAWSQRFSRGEGEITCTGCHNQEHSDLFNYTTYLPKILGPGHAARDYTGSH